MATLTLLGTAAAIPTVGHDTTFMLVAGDESTVLIDCGGSPAQKLEVAGLDIEELDYLLFTHRHTDHVYGVPLLLLNLSLLGRTRPLHLAGSAETLDVVRQLLSTLHWEDWPTPVPLVWHEVLMRYEALIADLPDLRLSACPVPHFDLQAIAIKVLDKKSGGVMVYSGDTGLASRLARFARGADVLVHEATGHVDGGHSSAAEAGQVAQQAGAGLLVLVHYDARDQDLRTLVREAEEVFGGRVELGRDFAVYEW
ncbi:MAG: MBL fold metallo-hydrolase [Chloroflexi bacterium]|nr:MBL fold metallo-hydrolase [Chloroflexota bacterium]